MHSILLPLKKSSVRSKSRYYRNLPRFCLAWSTSVAEDLPCESPTEAERPEIPEPLPPSRDARVLCERGCYAEAEKETLSWLAENSQDVSTMALLARVYANQGRLAQALSSLTPRNRE